MHQTTKTYRTYRLCGEKQTFFFYFSHRADSPLFPECLLTPVISY